MVSRKWKWGGAIALIFVAGCGLKLPFQQKSSFVPPPPTLLTSVPPIPISVQIDYRTLTTYDLTEQEDIDTRASYLEPALQNYPIARLWYADHCVLFSHLPEHLKLPLAQERIAYLRSGKLEEYSTFTALNQLGWLQGVEEARQFLRTYAADKKQLADNRRSALYSLSYFLGTGDGYRKRTPPNTQDLALLRAFLHSPDKEDRERAASAGDMPEFATDLLRHYQQEKEEEVRARILKTLGWTGEKRGYELVLSQSYAKRPIIKNAAITSLGYYTLHPEALNAKQRKQIRARLERFTDNHYVRSDAKDGLERLAKAERGEK